MDETDGQRWGLGFHDVDRALGEEIAALQAGEGGHSDPARLQTLELEQRLMHEVHGAFVTSGQRGEESFRLVPSDAHEWQEKLYELYPIWDAEMKRTGNVTLAASGPNITFTSGTIDTLYGAAEKLAQRLAYAGKEQQ